MTASQNQRQQSDYSRIHFFTRALRKNVCTLLLCAAGLVAGCQQPVITKPVELPAGSFTRKWIADLAIRGDAAESVYIRDEFLIVYTEDDMAYVMDRESGVLKWAKKVSNGGVALRPPVVLKDYIIFPTISSLEVYDRQGKNHRSEPSKGMALRSGCAGEGTHLYYGSDDANGGRVVSVDLSGSRYQSASTDETLQTRSGISSTPAVHQGLLYAADDVGGVYGITSAKFKQIWGIRHEGREAGVFGTNGRVIADLKVDDYGLYVASMDTKLYCISRTEGRIRWQYFSGVPLTHTPIITPTTVYQLVDTVGLVAIDKAKGPINRAPKWTHKTAQSFLAEDEKYIYLMDADHSIVACDKSTGESKFKSKRRDFVNFAIGSKNNVIYGVTRDGKVMAIVPVHKAGSFGELVATPVESADTLATAK